MFWLWLVSACGIFLSLVVVSVRVSRMLRPMRCDVRWLIDEIRLHKKELHPAAFSTIGRLEAMKLDLAELASEEQELRQSWYYHKKIEAAVSAEDRKALRIVVKSPLLPDSMPDKKVLPTEAIELALKVLAKIREKYHGGNSDSPDNADTTNTPATAIINRIHMTNSFSSPCAGKVYDSTRETPR